MGPDSTGRVRNIGDFGCLVTDWCMMIRQWGVSQMNPAELWEHIKSTGGTNGAYLRSGSLAAAFPGQVKYNGYTGGTAQLYDRIRANKDKGNITPVRVDFNPMTPQQEEHWVNIIDHLPGDNFTAVDPWTGKIIVVNLVYGIEGPDILTAQWYEPIMQTVTLEQALIARSMELQTISLNSTAALQARITGDGRQPVGSEGRVTFEGVSYALQPAESLTQTGRWVYYCQVGDWSNVKVVDG